MPHTSLPPWVTGVLSSPRLAPYVRAEGGDTDRALRLYWWNVGASAALYGPLHCLEVTLRNALHSQLSLAYRKPDWWHGGAPLNPHALRLVAKAVSKATRRGAGRPTADDLVAELTFGFWVALVSGGSRYDRTLWVPTLHRAFPHYDGSRAALYDGLSSLVLLRNRIMHHEPIHHRDLAADHEKIYRMIGYVSPEIAGRAEAMDRFPAVLASKGGVCDGTVAPLF